MASGGAEGANHSPTSSMTSLHCQIPYYREQSNLSRASPAPPLCLQLEDTLSCHLPPGKHKDPGHCPWWPQCSYSRHPVGTGPCLLLGVGCLCHGGNRLGRASSLIPDEHCHKALIPWRAGNLMLCRLCLCHPAASTVPHLDSVPPALSEANTMSQQEQNPSKDRKVSRLPPEQPLWL